MSSKGAGRSTSGGQSFFLFLLILVAGYNTYQTIHLQAEVSDLRSRLHAGDNLATVTRTPLNGEASSLFEQARKEIGQAEAKLHLKDYDRARIDLQQGVSSLERANAQTRSEGEKLLTELKTAAQSLQDKTIGTVKPPAKTARNTPSNDDSKQGSAAQ